MSASTQQANALTFANGSLASFASSLQNTLALAQQVQQQQSTHAYLASLQATATFAQGTDGSTGAQDGSPNNAHPIVGVNLSYNQLNTLFATLGDFVNFATGTAAPTAFDRRPIFGILLP
jgi:hypothetical protein